MRNAYRVLLEAVGSSAREAGPLTTGPVMPREELGAIPDNVRVERFAPQVEIMPLTSAVVCHGGSGTLLSTLAAGCPVVVIPLFADQPANARAAGPPEPGWQCSPIMPTRSRRRIRAVLASETDSRGRTTRRGRTGLHDPMNEAIAEIISIARK